MNRLKRMGVGSVGKIIALFAAVVLLCGTTCPAFAASPSKEEVIYVKTDASGHTKSVNAVNIFGAGSITDYGNYTDVRLMNSNEDISLNGDTVTFTTEENRVYYQGSMDPSTEIPWDISIRYYIDGVEVTPEEAAGASGTLQIRFSATENKACSSVFFDNYALQVIFLLDTEKCSIISAPDATIANVGSSKQLTYTILPGKGIDTAIVAQVRGFEMEAVSINGIALNMNMDIDDDDLMDKVSQLMTAVRKLNSGASELAYGAEELAEGNSELADGIDDLSDGAGKLSNATADVLSGAIALYEGANQVLEGAGSVAESANDLYNGLSKISNNSDSLNAGAKTVFESLLSNAVTQLEANGLGVGTLTIGNYKDVLNDVISSLDSEKVYQQALEEVTAEVEKNLSVIEAQVTEQVEQQVKANVTAAVKAQVTENVTAEVQKQVTASVIASSGMTMTVEEYEEAVAAGQIPDDVQSQIDGEISAQMTSNAVQSQINEAIEAQMASDEIQALTDKNLKEEMASEDVKTLIAQTVEATIQQLINEMMTSDEVQAELSKAEEGAQAVITIKQSLDDYNAFYLGVLAYTGSVDQAAAGAYELSKGASKLKSGAADLASGAQDLKNGISKINDGANDLEKGVSKAEMGARSASDGASDLADGADNLANGTEKFYNRTSGLDEEVRDEIDEILASLGGDDFEAVSFTSEKNTDVKSVQFVIKTDPIETDSAAEEESESEEKKPGFLQKLIRLFD